MLYYVVLCYILLFCCCVTRVLLQDYVKNSFISLGLFVFTRVRSCSLVFYSCSTRVLSCSLVFSRVLSCSNSCVTIYTILFTPPSCN